MRHDYKADLSQEEMAWVEDLLKDVPTFKNKHWFSFVKGISDELPNNPKILVLGCALGVEVIAFARWFRNPTITACDLWDGNILIENNETKNTKQNFLLNINKWSNLNVSAKQIDLYDKEKVKELLQTHWDFIFYDAFDLGPKIAHLNRVPLNEMFHMFWNNLKPGGILMGDDYYSYTNDNMTRFVESFGREIKKQPTVDISGYSWHWIFFK